ncbi:MAG: hypothetical protein HUU45_15620 [Leptospiraceae bacterium]|nr:hypothetical protein [Leptospiraceae bacterium]
MVDTNVLFSASHQLDLFNEDAERVFDLLARRKVPLFTNSNIRAEFLDLHRRVLIPEGLITLLENSEEDLDPEVSLKLKSLRTRYRRASTDNKAFLLQDKEIKDLRAMLLKFGEDQKDAWQIFCEDYLLGSLDRIWDGVVEGLGLNFLNLRADEETPELSKKHLGMVLQA